MATTTHDCGGNATLFPFRPLSRAVAWLVIAVGGIGCGGSPQAVPQQADASYQHLQLIRSAYLEASADLGRPPENAKELLPYIRYQGEGGPESVLRSPNDGLEYKIVWGVSREDLALYAVLAYEQQGKDGRRYVLGVQGIRSMTAEQFKKARFPPGRQPP